MVRIFKPLFSIAVVLLACAATLPAEIINFGSADYAFVAGQSSASFTAAGYDFTLTAHVGAGLGLLTPILTHEAGNGIGVAIQGIELNPEIQAFERLRIETDPSLSIFSFTLASIFREGFWARI